MTWLQRAIGVVTLVVLTMVPAASTMCALVCHDGDHAASHCEDTTGTAGDSHLRAAPAHECGSHDGVIGELAPPLQWRMAITAVAAPLDPGPFHAGPAPRTSPLTFASTAPPGSDPPTTTPTVLRV